MFCLKVFPLESKTDRKVKLATYIANSWLNQEMYDDFQKWIYRLEKK